MTFDDITIATYQNLFGNEANKIIQELQPRKLNDQLKKYELKLKHYEDLYQNEINMFESKLIQTSLNHQHTQRSVCPCKISTSASPSFIIETANSRCLSTHHC
ncbi:unnamed protein product [Rotaria socialis]|uniref:Uncharacterized protein n=1 Tax=Rotaria socialis TaxID=392032 RepID=A0A821G531_9BILA|nr:unnamed protein product [Rotaria socialis]